MLTSAGSMSTSSGRGLMLRRWLTLVLPVLPCYFCLTVGYQLVPDKIRGCMLCAINFQGC